MIQELLGGAGLIGVVGERKISVANALEGSRPSPSPSPTTSPSPSPSSSTATTTPTTSSAPADNQNNINLRCPRCDSANTKFCYYNNYNLTQPRHFCKTCRRYWTKGGALRNVPIGGGCRKNKNITVDTTSAGKSGRLKTCLSSEMVRSAALGGGGGGGGFEHQDLPSNPILWAQPHNSHLLSLLRANQNQNPNPSYGTGAVKDESVMIGSHMNTEASQLGLGMVGSNAGGRGGGGGALGWNSFSHQAPNYMGMCSTSSTPFWRSGSQRPQKQHQQQQQQQHGGFVLGEVQNTAGIQELYQRLRLSSSSSVAANYYYNPEHSPVFLSNIINNGASSSSTTSASSTILESAPVAVGEMAGYWNIPTLSSWTHDLQTTNAAYPN